MNSIDLSVCERWFDLHVRSRLDAGFDIVRISDPVGDFGEFLGFQFDSERYSGYLYFWENDMLDCQVVDMKMDLSEQILIVNCGLAHFTPPLEEQLQPLVGWIAKL